MSQKKEKKNHVTDYFTVHAVHCTTRPFSTNIRDSLKTKQLSRLGGFWTTKT